MSSFLVSEVKQLNTQCTYLEEQVAANFQQLYPSNQSVALTNGTLCFPGRLIYVHSKVRGIQQKGHKIKSQWIHLCLSYWLMV